MSKTTIPNNLMERLEFIDYNCGCRLKEGTYNLICSTDNLRINRYFQEHITELEGSVSNGIWEAFIPRHIEKIINPQTTRMLRIESGRRMAGGRHA